MNFKQIKYIKNIQSVYIQRDLFEYLSEKQKLDLIIYNSNYKSYSK